MRNAASERRSALNISTSFAPAQRRAGDLLWSTLKCSNLDVMTRPVRREASRHILCLADAKATTNPSQRPQLSQVGIIGESGSFVKRGGRRSRVLLEASAPQAYPGVLPRGLPHGTAPGPVPPSRALFEAGSTANRSRLVRLLHIAPVGRGSRSSHLPAPQLGFSGTLLYTLGFGTRTPREALRSRRITRHGGGSSKADRRWRTGLLR